MLVPLAAASLTVALAVPASGPARAADIVTPIGLTAAADDDTPTIPADLLGFSVESADLAHGFLTRDLLAGWLRSLGRHGVLRVGGYSMDLVWPAFGRWADEPAPPEAIGGTVDQGDLNQLAALTRATGWKVSIGLPLKRVIDPSKIKDPTKDPSPAVTLNQAVAEVVAAYRTLGHHLAGVEVGNEYDNVTTLTPAEMWSEMKRYKTAIDAALPHAHLKVIGPSANTATTNTKLDDFVSAVRQDTAVNPEQVLEEVSSHLYPGSHCGSSHTSIDSLLSASKYAQDQSKLDGITAIGTRLGDQVPMTIDETNSASCSGQPGVSDAYAMSLWSLDYLLQDARSGMDRVQFHTNTAAVCGDFKERTSPDYPISYRYYGAFCAPDQDALAADHLAAAPLYYGLLAFSQVPTGRFLDLKLTDDELAATRAYAVQGPGRRVTLVLINLEDLALAGSTTQRITVQVPHRLARGTAITLASADGAGLASLDASAVTLGGQRVDQAGDMTGRPHRAPVAVHGDTTTVDVAPGTARIVTLLSKD
ncbi:glycosyl hydrolase family 79 C-terminal domain-containing protein [Nocardioides sp. KR10-350]|uniref:glycosyl hydrolase family 79 C-terminal domain-containing protein n=1 Tax=Nocardioides cheoyonin TaxID=3156615 RepID=UPI0032B4E02B